VRRTIDQAQNASQGGEKLPILELPKNNKGLPMGV
jgi:hypothetical protein